MARSHHWDRLRLLAIYDIACFHVFYHWGLLGVGLPIFLVLTLALGVAGGETDVRAVAKKRFDRLIVPWFFWAIVILAVRLARIGLGARDQNWHWAMLFYGPSDHLWFLPTAFAGSVILVVVRRAAPRYSRPVLIVCASIAAALIAAPIPHPHRTPFAQWIWSLPALPLGYALGRAIEAHGGPRAARNDAAILCVAALVGFAMVSPWADATARDSLLRFGIGIAALTAVLFLPDVEDPFTRFATPLVLGVYLLHDPLYEFGLRLFRFEERVPNHAVAAVLLLLITGACVWILRRTRLIRVL
jgi:hypothetical protein